MKTYRCLLLLTAVIFSANAQTNVATNKVASTNSTNIYRSVQTDVRKIILHENNGKTCLISSVATPKTKIEVVLKGAPKTLFIDYPAGYIERKLKNESDISTVTKWGARLDIWEASLPKGEVQINTPKGQEILRYRAQLEQYRDAHKKVYAVAFHLRAEVEESEASGPRHHPMVLFAKPTDKREGAMPVWEIIRK